MSMSGRTQALMPRRGARQRGPGGMRLAARRGFTLVEVLIALSLLSMLMLVLTGALRAAGQTEERVESRIEAADAYRSAVVFLDQVLGQVSGRLVAPPDVTGQEAVFFDAQSDALTWIGVMPARVGLGGRHYMRLAREAGPAGEQLVLRYLPWTEAVPTSADWVGAARQPLAEPAQAISLRYLHPLTGVWQPVWQVADLQSSDAQLPAAVSIELQGPSPAWPPIIVAPRPAWITDASVLRAAAGGG